ncbi:hypothetical protein DEU31_1769 [Brachybacterium sp. AG952]|nr:hypothetical protein DEU31_1769 [Brachybacterium sp. AG952]
MAEQTHEQEQDDEQPRRAFIFEGGDALANNDGHNAGGGW